MYKICFFSLLVLIYLQSCGQNAHRKVNNRVANIKKQSNKANDDNEYFYIIDTAYSHYKLPRNIRKPEKWKLAEKQRLGFKTSGGYRIRVGYFGPDDSSIHDCATALKVIDTAKDFSKLCSAKEWCVKNYKQTFPFLVARFSNKRKIGLTNSADLIIYDRLKTGDMEFYGEGGCISEDIFTVAGRASWILNELTGESFAIVHPDLTKDESLRFKLLWLDYVKSLKK